MKTEQKWSELYECDAGYEVNPYPSPEIAHRFLLEGHLDDALICDGREKVPVGFCRLMSLPVPDVTFANSDEVAGATNNVGGAWTDSYDCARGYRSTESRLTGVFRVRDKLTN